MKEKSRMRIIGLDPGLRHTGWGVIESDGNRLRHIADGTIHPPTNLSMAKRLACLAIELQKILERFNPVTAAVEETFVNKNPLTTLRLGFARGVVMMAPALFGIDVDEYPANQVKKSVVGAGHADKNQVQMMIKILLPGFQLTTPDSADALAIAICHAHRSATIKQWYQPHAERMS